MLKKLNWQGMKTVGERCTECYGTGYQNGYEGPECLCGNCGGVGYRTLHNWGERFRGVTPKVEDVEPEKIMASPRHDSGELITEFSVAKDMKNIRVQSYWTESQMYYPHGHTQADEIMPVAEAAIYLQECWKAEDRDHANFQQARIRNLIGLTGQKIVPHVLKNGARVINTSPHGFQFSDGTACGGAPEKVVELLQVVRDKIEVKKIHGMTANQQRMTLPSDGFYCLDVLSQEADLVIVPFLLLDVLRQSGRRKEFPKAVAFNPTRGTQRSAPAEKIVDIDNWSW